jgi:uncharacterized protein YydD (DUF2326 family)
VPVASLRTVLDDGIVKEVQMATVEERVSYLEAKMEEVGKTLGELKGLIVDLDKKIDQRFMWLIGIQFAILIAIVAGLFGIVTRLIAAA